jgi:hypothetical protein
MIWVLFVAKSRIKTARNAGETIGSACSDEINFVYERNIRVRHRYLYIVICGVNTLYARNQRSHSYLTTIRYARIGCKTAENDRCTIRPRGYVYAGTLHESWANPYNFCTKTAAVHITM